MASKSSLVPPIVASVPRRTLTILRWIVEPLTAIEEKQRRRLRLLSVFLLIMAADTFAGMIAIKSAGNSIWVVMLATTAILVIGYCLSRTLYYRLATVFAVTIPAITIFAAILFSPDIDSIKV